MSDYKRLTRRNTDGTTWVKCAVCDIQDKCDFTKETCCQELQDRLAELEDKIEYGTLIELPCRVGDTVYVIADGVWHCQEVWQFRYDNCGLFVKTVGIYPYDFECGKTAFLTREEAEKRLLELQGETKL